MIHRSLRSVAISALALLVAGTGTAALAQSDDYTEIENQMQDIRQLELLEPLEITILTREELQAELAGETADAAATPVAEGDDAYDRVLIAFGLLDPDTDLDTLSEDLLGEQVAGYYDPESKRMVVVSGTEGDELSASDKDTFAHETTHALQDQHFDLETYLNDSLEGTDDIYLAMRALPEGDATVAEIMYLQANPDVLNQLLVEYQDMGDTEVLDTAPLLIQETLLFPYLQGQEFVTALYEEGGWDLVNEAYANPPISTEQILHPEKYLDDEAPVAIELSDPTAKLGAGWTLLGANTMGEFQIQVMLRDEYGVDEGTATDAAAGWGGDQYIALANGDDMAIIWQSAWDSDDDAKQFAQVLIAREADRLGSDVTSLADGAGAQIVADGVIVQITVAGDQVVYTQAPDADTLAAIQP